MSIEQWGVLALVVVLPLLEVVARLRQTHASTGQATDRVSEVPTSQRGSSLPNRDAHVAVVRAAKDVVSSLPSLPSLPLPLPPRASSPAMSPSGDTVAQ